MPFKSEKQKKWMFANKPEMALAWVSEEYKNSKKKSKKKKKKDGKEGKES